MGPLSRAPGADLEDFPFLEESSAALKMMNCPEEAFVELSALDWVKKLAEFELLLLWKESVVVLEVLR